MSTDLYPVGQCTDYVKRRFPQLSNGLGNAVDWFTKAKALGYQPISKPVPDTVVVFKPGCYGAGTLRACYDNPDGHVAVVDQVYNDGTFLVSEMNYSGWNYVDQRHASPAGVAGFFVPPGSSYTPPSQSASQGCITQGPFGIACIDSTIGGLVMAAGGFVMLVGVIVLVAASMKGTAFGRASNQALQATGGPARFAIQHHQAAQTRKRETAKAQRVAAERERSSKHTETMRRAQVRTARARARVTEAQARA